MTEDIHQTNPESSEFDFSQYPPETLFHERRSRRDRRQGARPASPTEEGRATPAPGERRAKKERRRRIDPTTFEKQYTDDELEFMNAMQRFKELSGKAFPTYGDVIRVAVGLGYLKAVEDFDVPCDPGDILAPPVGGHPAFIEN